MIINADDLYDIDIRKVEYLLVNNADERRKEGR